MRRTITAKPTIDGLAARASIGVLPQRALCDLQVLLPDDLIAGVWPAGEQTTGPAVAEDMSGTLPLLSRQSRAEADLSAMASALSRPRLLRQVCGTEQELSVLDIEHHAVLN